MSQKTAKRNRQARRAPARKPPTTSTGGGFLERVPRAWLYGGLAGIAVAVAVVLIVVNLTGGESKSSSPAAVDGSATAALLAGIPQDGISLGSPDAPVVLVEFADLQCPFCAQFAGGELPKLVEDYVRPGKLRIEFRGLTFIGARESSGDNDSEQALRFALAAGEQNKLWNVVDLLYLNQGPENTGWVTPELLDAIGAAVPGLDVAAADAAADSPAVSQAIQDSALLAQQRFPDGIATPSFLVGKRGGALTLVKAPWTDSKAFAREIDAALGS